MDKIKKKTTKIEYLKILWIPILSPPICREKGKKLHILRLVLYNTSKFDGQSFPCLIYNICIDRLI